MTKKLCLVIILFASPLLGLSQHTSKIYFIQQLDPERIFESPSKYTANIKFKSVGVELYQSKQNRKVDSMFTNANEFQILNDTVTFSVLVPDRFFSKGAELSLSPIFYLNDTKVKGGLPKYIQGKEQPVLQIKLKIKSDPSGATVYLIPKLYWEQNPQLATHNLQALAPYLVTGGPTTIYTYVQEYVYIAVFSYGNKFKEIPCEPNHLNPVDSIFTKLK